MSLVKTSKELEDVNIATKDHFKLITINMLQFAVGPSHKLVQRLGFVVSTSDADSMQSSMKLNPAGVIFRKNLLDVYLIAKRDHVSSNYVMFIIDIIFDPYSLMKFIWRVIPLYPNSENDIESIILNNSEFKDSKVEIKYLSEVNWSIIKDFIETTSSSTQPIII